MMIIGAVVSTIVRAAFKDDADIPDTPNIHSALHDLLLGRSMTDEMYVIAVKILARHSHLRLRGILLNASSSSLTSLKVKSLLLLSREGRISAHLIHNHALYEYCSTGDRLQFCIGRYLPGHIYLGPGKKNAPFWRLFNEERSIRGALRVYLETDDEELLDIIECIIPRYV
jgi:hypothetical protein